MFNSKSYLYSAIMVLWIQRFQTQMLSHPAGACTATQATLSLCDGLQTPAWGPDRRWTRKRLETPNHDSWMSEAFVVKRSCLGGQFSHYNFPVSLRGEWWREHHAPPVRSKHYKAKHDQAERSGLAVLCYLQSHCILRWLQCTLRQLQRILCWLQCTLRRRVHFINGRNHLPVSRHWLQCAQQHARSFFAL